MEKIKLVIFDLDGTLADTMEGLKEALIRTTTALGYPAPSAEEMDRIVNYDTKRFVREALPEGVRDNVAAVEQAVNLYHKNYAETCVTSKVYDGMAELLEHVAARCFVAIHSNKQDDFVKMLEGRLFRPRLFLAAEGSVPGRLPKPEPAGAWEIMKMAEDALDAPVTPEECVYVGDSDVDYLTAREAGMHLVSVAWGYRSEAFLRDLGDQPVAVTPAELWDILVSLGVDGHDGT